MKGRAGYDIRHRRRREIVSLAQHVGAADTDDYSYYLVRWAQALPESASRMVPLVQSASERMGRRIREREARAIVDQARSNPRPRTPDGWARALNLTYKVRQRIGITTIGAVDVNKRERARLRRLKDRQRKEQQRRERGARPQSASLARTKPWRAEGISRRTWERRRKRNDPAIRAATSAMTQFRPQQ
jgi:hypothetical protein